MFSMCSELTPRAPIPDSRIAQFMQPCLTLDQNSFIARIVCPVLYIIVCQNCVQFVWLSNEQVFSEQKMRNDEYNHI